MRKSSYLVSGFSFQDGIAALGHHIRPVLKYYHLLQVSAVVINRLCSSDPPPFEAGGGVCLLAPA